MDYSIHVGFKWQLNETDISDIAKRMAKMNGYDEATSTRKCINGHFQEKGKYCSECGNQMETFTALVAKAEWWTSFDENGYYINNINEVFYPIFDAVGCVDETEFDSIVIEEDELFQLLSECTPPMRCVFVTPDIYERSEDD